MVAMNENAAVQQVIARVAEFHAAPEWYKTVTLCDEGQGQYLIVEEGWRGWERIHRVVVHVECRDDKWWIQQDLTYEGVATLLTDAGIPKERIVLAFQHPSRRKFGDFAPI